MGKKRIIEQEGKDVSESGTSSTPKKSSKKRTQLVSSRIYVAASYNNTSVSVTDSEGNLIVYATAGSLGFKGPRKSTPFAASRVVETVFEKLAGTDIGKVSVYVRGVGSGRDASVRAIASRAVNITSIQDVTPTPHNGCRPRKSRRV